MLGVPIENLGVFQKLLDVSNVGLKENLLSPINLFGSPMKIQTEHKG